jgi:hypothetical protein
MANDDSVNLEDDEVLQAYIIIMLPRLRDLRATKAIRRLTAISLRKL